MNMFGKLAVTIVIALQLIGAAHAQLQATPAGWEPEQAITKSAAWVDEQVAVFERREAPANIKLALQLTQMLLPDEPVVTNQLAYYDGPAQPDRVYLDILAYRPDEPVANYYLAQNLSGEGFENLALPYYAAAARQRPDDLVVQYNAGLNAFYAEDNAACIAYLTRALAIGSAGADTEQAYLKRGECHARAGMKKQAEADFSRLEGNGGAYSVRMFREGVFNGCGWAWGSLDDRVRNAAAVADDWKTYEGYRELTRVLVCEPKHIGALRERLKLEERDNNLKRHAVAHRIQLQNLQDGGKTYAARLKALQPPTVAEMLAEGQAIDMSNDPGSDKRMRAAYLASRVLMEEPNNALAHLLRARAIANLGIGQLSGLAWSHATIALQIDPKLATAHFVRAILFMRGKGYAEAATELTAAIALDPNDMRFYAQRGDAYAQLGRNEPAVQDLTRFLASSPKDISALQGRALAYYNLKEYPAALADLNTAFGVDPRSFAVKASTVRVLDAMGRKADADTVHIVLMAEHEAEAKANTYLAARVTPELSAKAASIKDGQAYAALEKRAKDRFQAFVDEYSPGEYAYENLVLDMGAATSLDDKKLKAFRTTAEYAESKLKAAWRIGNALIDSDDAEGLTEEELGKLAMWLVHVENMQKGVADILSSIYRAQVD
jgi:tetratricopeptide (TPR) repeat protein